MSTIPYGTRYLIITCFKSTDRQFRGIYKVSRLLDRSPYLYRWRWDGSSLSLIRRRALEWVLVSGHGAEDQARLGDGQNNALTPCSLALPVSCSLFLLGCYQGKEPTKKEWARATGLEPAHVYGCGGETESVLSTLFMLNILDSGLQKADYWFERWIKANDYLRSWFPQMRSIYRENRMDFLCSLQRIAERIDLNPVEDFIRVGEKYPAYLSELG
jgi:hypothetical protein